jgi:heavy metal sensor kinase
VIGRTIRARLTAWYVGALAIATLTLAAASWWLSTRSVVDAADVGLQARVQGVRDFLDNPHTRLTVANLQDEFGEYAELTQGEALLDVVDSAGVVLCRPTIPGWLDMIQSEAPDEAAGSIRPHDRTIGAAPFRVAAAVLDVHGRPYRVTVAAPMGPAYEALNRFHRLLLLLLPLVVALAGAGGYWVSRRALAPVDDITTAVRAITVHRLDRRLAVPSADDELRRLAMTFNDVLARLETAIGDIVRFTADASHELRTPVSIVRTTAELALRHERTPGEYRAALADVAAQARHMSELVDDLLVLARTDAGIEARDMAPVDLGRLAAGLAGEMAELASGHGVSVTADVPGTPVMVSGDRAALRRLILILLDNAVKYSPPGCPVTIRVSQREAGDDGTGAAIEVIDRGIGLDPADEPRLFERFFRGARARQHAPDGTGLGLPIARAIAEQHGGTVGLGRGAAGTIACVELPLDR